MLRRHTADDAFESGEAVSACRIVDCYRIVGSAPELAEQLIRKFRQADSGDSPGAVAVTFEGAETIAEAQLERCGELARACRSARRELFVCGVTLELRLRLLAAGVLEAPRRARLFASMREMIESVGGGDADARKTPARRAAGSAGASKSTPARRRIN